MHVIFYVVAIFEGYRFCLVPRRVITRQSRRRR